MHQAQLGCPHQHAGSNRFLGWQHSTHELAHPRAIDAQQPGHVLAAILSTPWMLCEAITCKKSSGDDTPGAGAFTVTFCACAPQFWPNCAVCMTDGLVVS